jgi:hypothetical protein
MWYHFEFENGSNPYISKTTTDFLRMWRKYDLHTIKPGFYKVVGMNTDKTYKGMKARAEALAVAFSHTFGEVSMSWGDIADFQTIFETIGTRYGLLREFRENAIC